VSALPAREVADIDGPGVAPGDVEVNAIDGTVWGYSYACPGCGERSFLALHGENPEPRWTVVEGHVARPESVSLTPPILHERARGGCGWHGHLTRGRFVPC
jgi:hypothetical protein